MNELTTTDKNNLTSIAISVIIPAAGVGKRMASHCPKQYLTIQNKTILEHTVELFLAHPQVQEVVIVIGAQDEYFNATNLAHHPDVQVAIGGQERADSVFSGLNKAKNNWVMVHDAARPCVYQSDIDELIVAAIEHPVGAILACPVSDTIKSANKHNEIAATVPRETLWRALTPQMFPRDALIAALSSARDNQLTVTDEASAIELTGEAPLLVLGRGDNIKITQPEDLALASFFITQRQNMA